MRRLIHSVRPVLPSLRQNGRRAVGSAIGRFGGRAGDGERLRIAQRSLAASSNAKLARVPTGMQRSILDQPPTEVSTLRNGLRVATETTRGTGVATMGIWVDAGTRFETAETNGAAHFLEHLIFKGTKKRSQRELETLTEDMGAQLNAYTSREQTVYFARSMKRDVPAVVELLGDIFQNSRLDAHAVERERDVILREMQEVDQLPDETVFDYLHEVAYQNTPLSKTILGPEEKIRTMTAHDLRAYIDRHYHPHRLVFAAAGDVEHEQVVKLVEQHFGGMKPQEKPITAMDLVKQNPAYVTGSEVRVTNDFMPHLHFAIAVESVGWTHPDSVAFLVLQALLGQYERSAGTGDVSNMRLPRAMALHADHCKSFAAFNTTYTDTGLFGVYCVAEPPEVEDVALNIMTELVRTVYKIEEDALERAKTTVKANAIIGLDGSQNIAEDIGRQMLVFGRRVPLSEFAARVDEVDVRSLQAVADNYIYDREIAVAAMGPVWPLPEYQWLRRRTYWNTY